MGYTKLFKEGKIGPLTLKNRGIMMPMATDMADKDGIVTPRQIRYYQERAKGGVAMIINEYTGVDDVDSIPSIHNLRVARDYHISELEKLTDAVHLYGCKIVAQLHHGGATSNPAFTGSARNGDANCEPFSYQPGWKKHVAKAYKQALHIPVIATNTIKDPDFAEQLLEEGVCDFVGLGRSQLADPDFMKKARQGIAGEIRGCIGCLYCRERVLGQGLPIRCAVNARTAREIDFPHVRKDGGGSRSPGLCGR